MKYRYFNLLIFLFIFFYSVNYAISKKSETMVIGFTGDVMLGRMVNEILKKESSSYPWGNVLPLLWENDTNIINLETAITTHKQAMLKVFNFKTDPKNIESLLKANIKIVSLANNHILDFGETGLYETLSTLQKAGITYVGAGKTIQEAQKPYIFTQKGITIGVLGFTDNEPDWLATTTKPGINYIKVGDIEAVKKIVQSLRKKVDFIIASIHWGPNMRERPTQEFIDFAHQMIDAGIDIIHGHSAHIFQGIELYKNKLIMYDTGDFVDDYMVTPALRNNLSFLFQVKIDKQRIKSLRLTPVFIENMQVNLTKGNDYHWSMKRMQKLSKEFGTIISNDGILSIN